MKDRFFVIAVSVSVVLHVFLLAKETNWFGTEDQRVVRIPLFLEEEPPPPPPPPPPRPKPKPKPRKAKPQNVPEQVEKVVQGDGLRTGELVDAEVGDYDPGSPPPPPPPPPKPKINVRKLIRDYLQKVRSELAKRKRYPTVAQRMGLRGRVRVSFVILPDGSFDRIKIKRSSGQKMLDDAAVKTVAGLSGQLRRPGAMGPHPLKTSVTLDYQLN